jgi:enoyl-CoA hydratase
VTARPVETGTEKMHAHVDDRVGWVIYDNQARLNAQSYEMLLAVPRILAAFEADPEVRVVVVTGAGERAFISGADISEFGERRTSVEARAEYDRAGAEAAKAWDRVDRPIIAMIRGYCIGGGLLTAMRADIRIASEGSSFAVPAARLGLGYAYAGVEQLLALVGPAWAAEILFTARRLDAAEALRIGLVNRVVPAGDLAGTVGELAASIAANAPLTITAAKAAIQAALAPPERRDLDRVHALIEACFRSEDYLEGQQAFLERRPPRFSGR